MRVVANLVTLPLCATYVLGFQMLVRQPLSVHKSVAWPNYDPSFRSRDWVTFLSSRLTVRGSSRLALSKGAASQRLPKAVDYGSLFAYATSTLLEFVFFVSILAGLDMANTKKRIPFSVNCVVFYFLGLKSGLMNTMPNRQTPELHVKERKRVLPSWAPSRSGMFWVRRVIVGSLRAVSVALAVESLGSYMNAAMLTFAIHQPIADVWNSINEIELRYGTAVLGLPLLLGTKFVLTYQFYRVDPRAGLLQGINFAILIFYGAVVFRAWRVNKDDNGRVESLYPVKDAVTKRFRSY